MAVAKAKIIIFGMSALVATSGCRTKDQGEPEASSISASTDAASSDPTAQSKSAKPLKPKGAGATHSWDDGAGGEWRYFNKRLSWDEAYQKCDVLAKTTRKRWRMPSPVELQEALKRGILSSKNPTFGWMYLNQTWSSTWDSVLGSRVAVYVDLSNGKSFRTSVDHAMSTLCILTNDSGSNDTWVDDKVSQVWRYAGNDKDWASADKACRSMARNERLPWRMATMAELEAALKRGIQTDANPAFGKEYLTLTWSSESSTAFGPEAYVLDLRNSNQFLLSKEQRMHALCIRPLHH